MRHYITLLVVRGLPGSGKTTFAHGITPYVFEGNDYFYNDNGVYDWRPGELKEAHAWCFQRTVTKLRELVEARAFHSVVAVSNVHSMKAHIQPYAEMAKAFPDVRMFVVDLFDQNMSNEALAKSSPHGVPVSTIENMRNKWEH